MVDTWIRVIESLCLSIRVLQETDTKRGLDVQDICVNDGGGGAGVGKESVPTIMQV